MAPKKKFSRKQIIDAAFEIAQLEGIDHVTIRKVADRLESSIAPIYVNFNDVEELKQEVFQEIVELSHRMLTEQDSGDPFFDIGIASLRFAREYRVLFRDLVMKPNDYMESYDDDMGNHLVEQMKMDADLEGFTDEELRMILLKMRIFMAGLTIMVAGDSLPGDLNEEKEIELLHHTADDVITAARMRKNGNLQ